MLAWLFARDNNWHWLIVHTGSKILSRVILRTNFLLFRTVIAFVCFLLIPNISDSCYTKTNQIRWSNIVIIREMKRRFWGSVCCHNLSLVCLQLAAMSKSNYTCYRSIAWIGLHSYFIGSDRATTFKKCALLVNKKATGVGKTKQNKTVCLGWLNSKIKNWTHLFGVNELKHKI